MAQQGSECRCLCTRVRIHGPVGMERTMESSMGRLQVTHADLSEARSACRRRMVTEKRMPMAGRQ